MSFLVDSLTDTDGTHIDAHAPDTGDAWGAGSPSDMDIETNRLRTTDLSSLCANSTTPPSASYDVICEIDVAAAARDTKVYARYDAVNDNGLYFRLYGSSGRIYYGTRAGGVDNDVAYHAYGALTVDQTLKIRLVADGEALQLWTDTDYDGVLVKRLETTQGDITAAGKVAAYTSARATNPGVELSYIEANDLSGGGGGGSGSPYYFREMVMGG